MALLDTVDIVIDQVLSDHYGVASVEAMATGRLVITSIDPALYPSDCPIVSANPATLENVVRNVASGPEAFVES